MSNYTETEIHQALVYVARCSGNTRRAHDELARDGFRAPAFQTLHEWKTEQYAEEYRRIAERELPKVYAALAERNEDIALQYLDLEQDAIDQLKAAIPHMESKDAGNTTRNLATAKAIAIDKASVIRGRPTEIREDRTALEAVRALSRFAGIVTVNTEAIDGEAEDITDAPLPAPSLPSRATHTDS